MVFIFESREKEGSSLHLVIFKKGIYEAMFPKVFQVINQNIYGFYF